MHFPCSQQAGFLPLSKNMLSPQRTERVLWRRRGDAGTAEAEVGGRKQPCL